MTVMGKRHPTLWGKGALPQIHGPVWRAGLISLRGAVLAPQVSSASAQHDHLLLGCVAPPLQTCARANRRLARLPQGFVREDLRVPLRSRTPSWPSCWAASETVLMIQLRTFWCEQFGRARGLWRAVSGAGPRDLASAISRVFFGVGSSSWAFCASHNGAPEDGNLVKLSPLTPQTRNLQYNPYVWGNETPR